MKFSIGQISATVLAFTTFAQGAVILPRQDATTPEQNPGTDQNSTTSVESQYPNMTDIGQSNGTWYLTAISNNAFDAYQGLAEKMSVTLNCIQFNISASSNTSFDVIGSGFAENNVTHTGVNGTAAGIFMLQSPDSNVNVTDNELFWTAYFSQIYVNTAAWQNFTTGSSGDNNQTEGSEPVPGSEAIQASLYTKFIDSTGNNDTTHADTLLVWGSQFKEMDDDSSNSGNNDSSTTMTKRDGSTTTNSSNTVYAIILSRTSHVEDDTFNKTLDYLPTTLTQNNLTFVNLNDTCSSDNQ